MPQSSQLYLFLLAILVSLNLFSHEKIRLMTEDYPPLNYLENNELRGPAIDIVKEIQETLHLKSSIEVLPWARAYKTLERQSNAALFSTARSPTREKKFKWVGPIAEKQHVFVALNDLPKEINELKDLKDLPVVALRGSIHESYLKRHKFSNIHLTNHESQNPKMLIAGRVNLWFTSISTSQSLLKKSNIPAQKTKHVFYTSHAKLYIAFNKRTPDKIIKQWQQAYQKLYHNGRVKEIFDQHQCPYLYPKQQSIPK